ncbi:hypothetical protein WJX81_002745 [Elliptochloris bilobata]|uniref:Carboxypeptidase n=1 Tax=Elliptochloris bilobata TaxID=381761 RepID=A0AAW1RQP3_9CHLO
MFYTYHEAQHGAGSHVPVILWLEGGPGCASMYGSLYINGPQRVTAELSLRPNEGSWNLRYGVLYIDQPVGTGFSTAGSAHIPTDEMEVAAHLYIAIQAFFERHSDLQRRPFFITGESYAGKYVPSIGHFILQAERLGGEGNADSSAGRGRLAHTRALPSRYALRLRPPAFRLAGLAIGNGLTDPGSQVLRHADVLHYMGLIDKRQRINALQQQLEVAELITLGLWDQAHQAREALLGYLTRASGVGTLLDTRRARDYDPDATVDRYLNQPAVKETLGVPANATFEACSSRVGAVLGPDVMKSTKYLIPDILASMPLLLYQGATDAQDGPALNEPWIESLDWPGARGFEDAERELWRLDLPPGADAADPDPSPSPPQACAGGCGAAGGPVSAAGQGVGAARGRVLDPIDDLARASHPGTARRGGEVVGYWREHATLTHVVIRNAGHMVPHDRPLVAQEMLRRWVKDALRHEGAAREGAAAAAEV